MVKGDFVYDTEPKDNKVIIIDANCQGFMDKTMKLVQVEFPETFAKIQKHIFDSAETPYLKFLPCEERHYKLVVMFGMSNKYGNFKDTDEEIKYAIETLLKGIVQKMGDDKEYHSLIPYKGFSNIGQTLYTINKIGVKWFLYKE